jgi:sugar/nucleoside kinase (ribokinase family)
MLLAAGSSASRFCQWAGALGERASVLTDNLPAQVALFHVEARLVLGGASDSPLRLLVDSARRQGALISLDLGPPDWIRQRGGSRTTYQLAALRPDVLFASTESAAEVGSPLEGLASVPVTTMGEHGCTVYGRRVVAPVGIEPDVVGFMAAFCVAFVEGLSPVEAAGRAVLAAAGGLVSAEQEVESA